jgi:hypothetical protein
MSSYGYMRSYRPPAPPRPPRQPAVFANSGALARAAAGHGTSPFGVGSGTGFGQAPRGTVGGTSRAGYPASRPQQLAQAAPQLRPGGVVQPQAPPTAAGVNAYDLNTDPALAQIKSLVGLSNEQAQSGALHQRQDLLLAYGDPALAAARLGPDDPLVAAAGNNPTSTVHQLGQQRDRNLKQLDDALNDQNLTYSGYRVNQESQAAQDFQNALATAAGQVNSGLGQIDSNLASALGANQQQLVQAISDAAARAQAAAAASGADPGAAAGGGAGTDTTTTGGGGAGSGIGDLTPALADILGQAAMQTAADRANAGYDGPVGGAQQTAYSPASPLSVAAAGTDASAIDAQNRLRKLLGLAG